MAIAVDTFAELSRIHAEHDEPGNMVAFDKHTTTYANGLRCVDYELTITDDGSSTSVMLTSTQMRALCFEMQAEWALESLRA